MTRAKEITKEAKKFAKEIDDWEIAEDVQDAFEQGAQWADAHPYWISVEDELPMEGQSCIILIDRKALQGMPRIRSAVYAPNVMMQQEGFAYNRVSKKHHITHWMPLPQPPLVTDLIKKGLPPVSWQEGNILIKKKGGEE